jgi:hypothetical protein
VTIVELVDIAWLPWDEQEGAAFNGALAAARVRRCQLEPP